jgi:hypothetical protein
MTTLPGWVLGLALIGTMNLVVAPASAADPEPLATEGTVSPGAARDYGLLFTLAPIVAGIAVPFSSEPSTATTITSGALLWGGALFGPAMGYRHGGVGHRAHRGVVFRCVCFGLAWAASPTSDFDDGFIPNPDWGGTGTWVLAGLAIIISDIRDLSHTSRAVREGRAGAPAGHASVVPYVDPTQRSIGVVFTWNGPGAHAF